MPPSQVPANPKHADVQQRAGLAWLLDRIEDGLLLLGRDGRVSFTNSIALEILGDGLLGRPWSEVGGPLADRPDPEDLPEIEVLWPENGKTLGARWFALPTGGGAFLVRDRSQRVEQAEREANFQSMIAHDLRSPVAVVHGYLDLMLGGVAGELSPMQDEFLGRIGEKLEEISLLLNDFLDLSRFDAGAVPLNFAPTNLGELLNSAANDLSILADQRSMSLELELEEADEGLFLHADRQRLGQLLQNLLGNALKYNRPQGRIILRAVVESPDSLRLEVQDEGPGLDEEQCRRVFEPFIRLPEDEHAHEGAGLGLLIVRKIAEGHGGEVGVRSQPGRGSTFWVRLPREVVPVPG